MSRKVDKEKVEEEKGRVYAASLFEFPLRGLACCLPPLRGPCSTDSYIRRLSLHSETGGTHVSFSPCTVFSTDGISIP